MSCPGVPFGRRLPQKRGPYSTPKHTLSDTFGLDAHRFRGVIRVPPARKNAKGHFTATFSDRSLTPGIPAYVGNFATEREAAAAYDLACHIVGREPVNFPDHDLAGRLPDAVAAVRARLSKRLKDA